MNHQPVAQPKSATNGFPHRRLERDCGTRSENKVHSIKSNSGRMSSTAVFGIAGPLQSPLRDRLVYLTTCLIGHPVEVQLKNGSVYTGVFHAADAEKDFGIILKMARMIKDGAPRGQKPRFGYVSMAPLNTLIISAKELLQVIAKDAAVTGDDFSDDFQSDKHLELLTDSYISQSVHVEVERELKPWVPDEDVPQCPELENIFDGRRNRGWDQFEANEMLFGVKSTFNEELYTTKLERGPRMRELEQEAIRIAREIEGEDTQDLHVAEERGFLLHENFDIDEETRYSSVKRGVGFDDGGYEDEEDILLDSHNTLTFDGVSASDRKRPASVGCKMNDEAWDDTPSSQSNSKVDLNRSVSDEHAWQLASECSPNDFTALNGGLRMENQIDVLGSCGKLEFLDKQRPAEDFSVPSAKDSQSLLKNKEDSDRGRQSDNAKTSVPSSVPSKTGELQSSTGGQSGTQGPGKAIGNTKSKNLDTAPVASASSGRGLSPSSSVGSLSSEKSTLNPNAKEFKLNPNAKSFKPSNSSVRPPSPMSDGSLYFPAGVSAVPQMPGMPVGYGMGPSFSSHQPVMYAPQLAPVPSPQTYFPPNVSQYGQQMLLGQPRPVVYMPNYHHEMPYRG